jgi:hypothetical protein
MGLLKRTGHIHPGRIESMPAMTWLQTAAHIEPQLPLIACWYAAWVDDDTGDNPA